MLSSARSLGVLRLSFAAACVRVPEKFSLDFCPAMAHCLVRAMRL
jgi:hypothetical protein